MVLAAKFADSSDFPGDFEVATDDDLQHIMRYVVLLLNEKKTTLETQATRQRFDWLKRTTMVSNNSRN